MNSLKHILLLSIILLSISSCGHELGGPSREGELSVDIDFEKEGRELSNTFGPAWEYSIAISFKDKEGNDLVSPLAEEQWDSNPDASHWAGYINPDRLHLDVIYSNPPDWFDNTTYTHKASPEMIPDEHVKYCTASQYGQSDSPWYVVHGEATYINTWGEEVRDLTLKITCPTIFGDNEIHEFATCWEEGDERRGEEWLAKCTKLVFEGQDYIPEKKIIVKHFENFGEEWDTIIVDYLITIVLDK
ncbi:MAG: hypothetical protein J6Y83_00770 [Bacteroidales bacterium]|nr:hypothetical protein [Bacteroidales bacterium]